MPTFCYILLPLLGAVLAFVIARRWLKHGDAKKKDEFGHPCSLVLGAGIFFLVGFALLAFVPEAASESARGRINWRMILPLIALIGLPITFFSSLSALTIALIKDLNRHAVVSMLAWAAVVGSGWLAIGDLSWIPIG